ncbi:MotE family protein [Niallia sp. 01092]|uniref:MotE family protein n=1 Tax=unclassified Niallia TaxID=2837522 RepID=UPI003FD4899B
MENLVEEKKKTFNFFQRFLLVFVIPTVFAIVVLLLLMIYSGADVLEKGKELANNLPFLSSEKASSEEKAIDQSKKIHELENKLSDQNKEISKLQSELDNKMKQVGTLQLDKEKLQNKMEALQKDQEQTEQAFNEIVKTYETMSAKSSAAILAKMNEQEGLKILAALKPATLAPILEKMDPQKASQYTELLSKTSAQNNTEANNGSTTEANLNN